MREALILLSLLLCTPACGLEYGEVDCAEGRCDEIEGLDEHDLDERNETESTATHLGALTDDDSGWVEGTISAGGDRDYYKISVSDVTFAALDTHVVYDVEYADRGLEVCIKFKPHKLAFLECNYGKMSGEYCCGELYESNLNGARYLADLDVGEPIGHDSGTLFIRVTRPGYEEEAGPAFEYDFSYTL